ncbi:ABC transporter ATP-binding protein [Paenibacillus albiflavus]|nr:ABC transporter ATP-binding protein [Paenibacillus albiflavus]
MFKDLSITVPEGQKVLLLGPSGCGKSTLLQVLSGIIPNSIEVPLKYDEIQRSASWGFVFQDPDTQFCMPYVDEELAFVLENLSVPREQMKERIHQALASVGLLLEDPHTPIQTLSQGMKQRLALASILLLEPDVIYLDEPTALLDPEGTVEIWNTVKSIASSKTIIIVEHKIDQIVDLVDRIVLFNHAGEIIADGVPHEIFQKNKQELVQFGIWYPEVWEDYLSSDKYQALQQQYHAELALANELEHTREPVIRLQEFSGFHGDVRKIHVPEAVLYAGEWLAIVGSNGAGKSTFLQSLMQLLRTEGLYQIEGEQIVQTTKRIRKQIVPSQLAFVFQNPEMQFITNSVNEEVSFSSSNVPLSGNDSNGDIQALLNKFDLAGLGERHPYQLSMGQKRRLSIASSIFGGQKIVLLDEPTFGQDARNTFAILEMIEGLRLEGAAIVMVTHDLHIVQHYATRVWTISEGQLIDSRLSGRGGTNGVLYTAENNMALPC